MQRFAKSESKGSLVEDLGALCTSQGMARVHAIMTSCLSLGVCSGCALRFLGVDCTKWCHLPSSSIAAALEHVVNSGSISVGDATSMDTNGNTRVHLSVVQTQPAVCAACRGLLQGRAFAWAVPPSFASGSCNVLYNSAGGTLASTLQPMLDKLRPGQGTTHLLSAGAGEAAAAAAEAHARADEAGAIPSHAPTVGRSYTFVQDWPGHLVAQVCSGGYDLRDGISVSFQVPEAIASADAAARRAVAAAYCASTLEPRFPFHCIELKDTLRSVAASALQSVVYDTSTMHGGSENTTMPEQGHAESCLSDTLLSVEQAESSLCTLYAAHDVSTAALRAVCKDDDRGLARARTSAAGVSATLAPVHDKQDVRMLKRRRLRSDIAQSSGNGDWDGEEVEEDLVEEQGCDEDADGIAIDLYEPLSAATFWSGTPLALVLDGTADPVTAREIVAAATEVVRQCAYITSVPPPLPSALDVACACGPESSSRKRGSGGLGGWAKPPAAFTTARIDPAAAWVHMGTVDTSVSHASTLTALSLGGMPTAWDRAGGEGSVKGAECVPGGAGGLRRLAIHQSSTLQLSVMLDVQNSRGKGGRESGLAPAAEVSVFTTAAAVAQPPSREQQNNVSSTKQSWRAAGAKRGGKADRNEKGSQGQGQRQGQRQGQGQGIPKSALQTVLDVSTPAVQLATAAAHPPTPIENPTLAVLTSTLARSSVFVGGSYVKVARGMSQTPWYVGGLRRDTAEECSVEENIGYPLSGLVASHCGVGLPVGILPLHSPLHALLSPLPSTPVLESKHHAPRFKFHSAGREDVDVRMLGGGRPFVLELLDARPALLPLSFFTSAQAAVNSASAGKLEIRRTGPTTRDTFTALQVGAENKRKKYVAVCWASTRVTQSLLNAKLAHLKDLAVAQRTPIRVLHRRSLMTRQKVVHAFSARLLTVEEGLSVQTCLDGVSVDWEGSHYCPSLRPLPLSSAGKDAVSAAGELTHGTASEAVGTEPAGATSSTTAHSSSLASAEPSSPFFLLAIETSAGTYVKELVHGDCGRTVPSIAGLLGVYAADILSLDVVELVQGV